VFFRGQRILAAQMIKFNQNAFLINNSTCVEITSVGSSAMVLYIPGSFASKHHRISFLPTPPPPFET